MNINDFDIGSKIGQGGFASVYQVKYRKNEQEYALKVIDKSTIESNKLTERVQSEIQIHQRIQHNNIVQLYDCFEDEKNIYFVLELCQFGNFYQYLRKYGPLSELQTALIIYQLLQCIQYLHTHGIVHRDLKLSNMLIKRLNYNDDTHSVSNSHNNININPLFQHQQLSPHHHSQSNNNNNHTYISIKLCDFGLASEISHPDEEHYTICGTPNYIAPEILLQQSHGYPVDIWAIGCLMYSMLTGSLPPSSHQIGGNMRDLIAQTIMQGIYNNNNNSNSNSNNNSNNNNNNNSNSNSNDEKRIEDDRYQVSSIAIDFMNRIFETNPLLRPTAELLLQHPYILSAITTTTTTTTTTTQTITAVAAAAAAAAAADSTTMYMNKSCNNLYTKLNQRNDPSIQIHSTLIKQDNKTNNNATINVANANDDTALECNLQVIPPTSHNNNNNNNIQNKVSTPSSSSSSSSLQSSRNKYTDKNIPEDELSTLISFNPIYPTNTTTTATTRAHVSTHNTYYDMNDLIREKTVESNVSNRNNCKIVSPIKPTNNTHDLYKYNAENTDILIQPTPSFHISDDMIIHQSKPLSMRNKLSNMAPIPGNSSSISMTQIPQSSSSSSSSSATTTRIYRTNNNHNNSNSNMTLSTTNMTHSRSNMNTMNTTKSQHIHVTNANRSNMNTMNTTQSQHITNANDSMNVVSSDTVISNDANYINNKILYSHSTNGSQQSHFIDINQDNVNNKYQNVDITSSNSKNYLQGNTDTSHQMNTTRYLGNTANTTASHSHQYDPPECSILSTTTSQSWWDEMKLLRSSIQTSRMSLSTSAVSISSLIHTANNRNKKHIGDDIYDTATTATNNTINNHYNTYDNGNDHHNNHVNDMRTSTTTTTDNNNNNNNHIDKSSQIKSYTITQQFNTTTAAATARNMNINQVNNGYNEQIPQKEKYDIYKLMSPSSNNLNLAPNNMPYHNSYQQPISQLTSNNQYLSSLSTTSTATTTLLPSRESYEVISWIKLIQPLQSPTCTTTTTAAIPSSSASSSKHNSNGSSSSNKINRSILSSSSTVSNRFTSLSYCSSPHILNPHIYYSSQLHPTITTTTDKNSYKNNYGNTDNNSSKDSICINRSQLLPELLLISQEGDIVLITIICDKQNQYRYCRLCMYQHEPNTIYIGKVTELMKTEIQMILNTRHIQRNPTSTHTNHLNGHNAHGNTDNTNYYNHNKVNKSFHVNDRLRQDTHLISPIGKNPQVSIPTSKQKMNEQSQSNCMNIYRNDSKKDDINVLQKSLVLDKDIEMYSHFTTTTTSTTTRSTVSQSTCTTTDTSGTLNSNTDKGHQYGYHNTDNHNDNNKNKKIISESTNTTFKMLSNTCVPPKPSSSSTAASTQYTGHTIQSTHLSLYTDHTTFIKKYHILTLPTLFLPIYKRTMKIINIIKSRTPYIVYYSFPSKRACTTQQTSHANNKTNAPSSSSSSSKSNNNNEVQSLKSTNLENNIRSNHGIIQDQSIINMIHKISSSSPSSSSSSSSSTPSSSSSSYSSSSSPMTDDSWKYLSYEELCHIASKSMLMSNIDVSPDFCVHWKNECKLRYSLYTNHISVHYIVRSKVNTNHQSINNITRQKTIDSSSNKKVDDRIPYYTITYHHWEGKISSSAEALVHPFTTVHSSRNQQLPSLLVSNPKQISDHMSYPSFIVPYITIAQIQLDKCLQKHKEIQIKDINPMTLYLHRSSLSNSNLSPVETLWSQRNNSSMVKNTGRLPYVYSEEI